MKILVLENVDRIPEELLSHFEQHHQDDDIEYITNLKRNLSQMMISIKECDELHIASSFYDTDQFTTFLGLILQHKNIKAIKISYLYSNNGNNKFIDFLNDLQESDKKTINKILKQTTLSEICCSVFELDTGKESYFKKIKYTFDIVPIYYNKKYKVFWHERQPVVPKLNSFLYINETVKISQNVLKHYNLYTIEKIDDSEFVKMIEEMKLILQHQIESCKEHNYEESEELIKEKNNWLKIISKLNHI